jgi:hypothetical protein
VDTVKEMVGEMQHELTKHRKPLTAVGVAIAVLLIAGAVAALLGSTVAVVLIASIGILGTAVAVLVYTGLSQA